MTRVRIAVYWLRRGGMRRTEHSCTIGSAAHCGETCTPRFPLHLLRLPPRRRQETATATRVKTAQHPREKILCTWGLTATAKPQLLPLRTPSGAERKKEPGGHLTFRPVFLLQNSAFYKNFPRTSPDFAQVYKNYYSLRKGA